MKETLDTPGIYVACLASYNAGMLHGIWISSDEATSVEEIEEGIKAMLGESPSSDAEEWAIHDTNGIPFTVSENPDLNDVAGFFAAWEEDEEKANIAAEWSAHTGQDFQDAWERYDDQFHGTWESVEDYVMDFWEDNYTESDNWWHPSRYVDWERMGRDLELSGDIVTVRLEGGDVAIFSSH